MDNCRTPPKVNKATLIKKLKEGIVNEGGTILGRQLTFSGCVKPLIKYLKSRGIKVVE